MLISAERDVGIGGKIGQLETFDLRPREIDPIQVGVEKLRIVEVGGKEARIRTVAFREIAVAQIAVLEHAVSVVARTECTEHHDAMREGRGSNALPGRAIDCDRELDPDGPALNESSSKGRSAGHCVAAEIAFPEFGARQVRLYPSATAVLCLVAKGTVSEHSVLEAAFTETAIYETRVRNAGSIEVAIDERAIAKLHLMEMVFGYIDTLERDILRRFGSPYRLFEFHGQ